jgi:hypothetical protein
VRSKSFSLFPDILRTNFPVMSANPVLNNSSPTMNIRIKISVHFFTKFANASLCVNTPVITSETAHSQGERDSVKLR